MRRNIFCATLLITAAALQVFAGAGAETLERHGVALERPGPIPNSASLEAGVRADYERRSSGLDRILSDASSSRDAIGLACGELGLWLHAYRYFARAELAYACAEAFSPVDPRWPYHRAALALRSGDAGAARAAYERTLASRADYIAAAIHLADLEWKTGNPDAAARWLARVPEADPAQPFVHGLRARIALDAGRPEEARTLLERALARSPDDVETHHLLVRVHRALGDAEAVKRHSEAARSRPRAQRWAGLSDPYREERRRVASGASALMQQGHELLAAGRPQDALALFRRAVESSPGDRMAQLNLGAVLQRTGDLEGAEAIFQQIVRTHPASAPHPELALAYFNLGAVQSGLGRDDEAEASYRESLRSDPEQRAANRALGLLLARSGRSDQALSYLGTAIARDPADPLLRFHHAAALVVLARDADAKAELTAALVAIPDEFALLLLLARLHAASSDDSIRDAKRAVSFARRLTPRNSLVVAETLAMVAAEAGHFAEAVRWQRAGLDAIRAQGLAEVEPRVVSRLALYEAGSPCREAWLPEESASADVTIELPVQRKSDQGKAVR